MSKGKAPEIISVSAAQLAELLVGLRQRLPDALYEQVAGLLQTLQWVMVWRLVE